LLFVALWCLSLAAAPRHTADVQPQHLHHHGATRMSMACVYAIEAYGLGADALPRIVDEAFDEVDRIDRLMSHYKAGSPLSRINREAAQRPVTVEPEPHDSGVVLEARGGRRDAFDGDRSYWRSDDPATPDQQLHTEPNPDPTGLYEAATGTCALQQRRRGLTKEPTALHDDAVRHAGHHDETIARVTSLYDECRASRERLDRDSLAAIRFANKSRQRAASRNARRIIQVGDLGSCTAGFNVDFGHRSALLWHDKQQDRCQTNRPELPPSGSRAVRPHVGVSSRLHAILTHLELSPLY
jgi:hypothetical protein